MSDQETTPEVNSTFQNEHLTVVIERFPHCQVKFDLTVAPAATRAAYQKALKNVNKNVNVPGFRKGKAPEHFVKERYASAIQEEFIDTTMQTAFNEAVHLTHLAPLKEGQMKRPMIKKCDPENGAHIILEFETYPTIPTINLGTLKLQKIEPHPVTDQERANALESIQFRFTTFEPIEDRGVEENDFVEVDVTLLRDPPQEVIKNQRTRVSPTSMPSWIREKIMGLKAGESAEGMTDQDPELSTPDPDFQSVPYRVTVNAIYKGEIPEVNDELAIQTGLKSVEELKQKIHDQLEREAEEEVRHKTVEQLKHFLLTNYPVDIPKTYIDRDTESRFNEYIDRLEDSSQLDENAYKQIKQEIEQISIRSLQLYFLLQQAGAEHQIEVDANDISKELSRQVMLMQQGKSALDMSGDQENLREQLRRLAFAHKIEQFLIDHAQDHNH